MLVFLHVNINLECERIITMEKFIKTFKELNIDDLYEILRLRVDVFVVEQA